MTALLIGCAICFGSADPRMTFILMGLLALPFTMVGGMFTFLYYKGVFSGTNSTNPPASDAQPQ
jgi:hypothetical protein